MKEFLAKTNPKETIQEHTDQLLKNYNLLKSAYPNLNVDWDMLYMACVYHDLGKINRKFQNRLKHGKRDDSEIPHGILSLAFINYEELENNGYSEEDISVLFHTVGYHHDRKLDFSLKDVDDEIELMQNEIDDFKYDKFKEVILNNTIEEEFFILKDRIYRRNGEEKFFKYIMLKGLLNRIDYAASAHLPVENENNFLLEGMENLLNNWKRENPNSEWNKLQKFMIENRNRNTIVAAQTGMGKTEAGLLWIGNNKGFFTLPIKTAINSIYKRIIENIVTDNFSNKVGLLHSDIMSVYLNTQREEVVEIDIQEYFNKTKQLSLPLTICTIDQTFDFVYRYKGFEPKLATLSYSKVVIDEIQMYSPLLLSYLIVGIKYITQIGGKFSILTATLPKFIVEILKDEKIEFVYPKEGPFIDTTMNRHRIKVIQEDINSEYIKKLYNKNKVLVICNTVKKAQEIYINLKKDKVQNINLLHARFILSDRKDKEKEITDLGKKESKNYGIWISTQIVEASLDIDFDLLITELSDLAGLFQRMGRCYRNRELDNDEFNCHVFIGTDDKKCSGVGRIIDKDIFNLSRKYIINKKGIFTEQEKMDMVDEVYSMDKLKDTDYYKELCKNIDYLQSIEDFEKEKSEVQKKFRNIDSETVIPLKVYEENIDIINECITIVNQKFDECMNEREKKDLKLRKISSKDRLMGFTVNIRGEEVKDYKEKELRINKYESIPIVRCKYDNEIGVLFSNEDKNKNIRSTNMF
ncbi:CRISPR-associated helicase Cas3' [Acidilutibacter cellobiosedens]|uniref:CRISPR-associated helicase Cas3 n=1 Tax=Acidilutibacter cellobiosedens TaxID=2507161 RepID=A0A410QD06_9FIRM|nr:CRISPR-associated helicase Cas3' [Acidilutibacter cellobiosedens]QAT61875.1 CRISPR-associated helicase Cas3' [Acidilutibacter cellobiosedens]